ncbi:hypothetical protein ACQ9ZF_07810 [Cetobacterium somerae]|uniref:family 4 glycosyl hydrolase n=1 Tax=Cetobacterium somerae TaxID=188913 RepID=UPI003D7685AE
MRRNMSEEEKQKRIKVREFLKQNPISSPDYLIRYGMIEQETNSANRFAKAPRTIPIILDTCKDMTELCSNA